MIINYNFPFLSLKFDKGDWDDFSAYKVISYIKSLPKKHYYYKNSEKTWYVFNKKDYIREIRNCMPQSPFSKKENYRGELEYNDFINQFNTSHF